jgi:hypothetical protein
MGIDGFTTFDQKLVPSVTKSYFISGCGILVHYYFAIYADGFKSVTKSPSNGL